MRGVKKTKWRLELNSGAALTHNGLFNILNLHESEASFLLRLVKMAFKVFDHTDFVFGGLPLQGLVAHDKGIEALFVLNLLAPLLQHGLTAARDGRVRDHRALKVLGLELKASQNANAEQKAQV